ncbi:MAG: carbohydrate kinase family protein [Clostridiaceae bacterium]
MKSILCFGDCNLDIIIPIREIPVKGGCSFSSELSINMGGSGLNTAVALNRLKLKPVLLSKIGSDNFGTLLYDFLKSQGMQVEHIQTSDLPTGVVVGLVNPDGEKRWISVRGNAADIHMTQYNEALLQQYDVLYLSGVELAEGKESREIAIELARKMKEKGGSVFLDPNIRVPTWKIDAAIKEAFRRIYPYVDVLLPNKKELEMMGGNSNFSLDEKAKFIMSKGVSSIWLKLGGDGCTCYTQSGSRTFSGNRVEAIDTSGAGDAFNAAVIYGIITGMSQEETGLFANFFASHTVTKYGTTQALPSSSEIDSMIQKAKQASIGTTA